ncbi:MAG TPA: hypothetical protein VKZ58_00965 [Longimicrobiales bacterium]|nr:hypothetical protein [Longimicrobiales bacterium]
MRIARTFRLWVLAALLPLAACAPRVAERGTLDPEAAPPDRRAALARLTVENRTDYELVIVYREAARPAGVVELGSVEPRQVAELAPIPAGEPIVLAARTPSGAEYRLAPRSFETDELMHWVIPEDAPFTPSGQVDP